jgi:hypothetical protein
MCYEEMDFCVDNCEEEAFCLVRCVDEFEDCMYDYNDDDE